MRLIWLRLEDALCGCAVLSRRLLVGPRASLLRMRPACPLVNLSCLTLSAAACEFLDIVELLLQSGADPTLRDQDGCLPEEVTGCKAVSSVLQRHTAGKA